MAINKDEIEKYIFDPENPEKCKTYGLLLNIAKKGARVFIDYNFTRNAYRNIILVSKFDDFIWDKPSDYSDLDISQKIDLYIQNNSEKEFNEYISNLNIDSNNFVYNKVFNKFLDYTPFGMIKLINSYSKSLTVSKIVNPNKIDFTGYSQYKTSYDFNKPYQGHKILFTNDENVLDKTDYFYDVSTVLITSSKELLTKELHKNIKLIFLERIEDVDILLNVLGKELNSGYLDSIKIKNYFSLKDIEIPDLKDKKEIYFVGENGDGKTILLQAILLALTKEYSGIVIEHIRNIKDTMELSAKDEFSTDYYDTLDIKNVFAYGINRNKVHYSDFDSFGYSGLFDTSDSRKTTYLKDPFYELGEEYKGDNPLIKEFIKKLNTIILREDYNIFSGGDVDFNELSEGYKSTIIWLYDLVSRLKINQPEITELEKLKAIVLIDEVDLYLHPKWKYDFVHSLRVVFKEIQFIMVTHSTETILGASDDAVFFKVYKEEGITKISQPMHDIKNFMANSLSTSPLFDMDTARARNNDNNLDTREDFISSKIHNIIKERVKGKKAIVEDEIVDMINQELDDYLKENDL